MINWLIQQQGVLSVTLILLMLSTRWLTPYMGAKRAYRLWLLVVFILGLHNLPAQMMPLPASEMARYVVGLNPGQVVSPPDFFMPIWLIGVTGLAVVMLNGYLRLRLSVSRRQVANQTAFYSTRIGSPILMGLIAPKIVLPVHFSRLFDTQQQALIIEHEKTHLVHRDHVWNALAVSLAVIFWFNPLAWLALSAFRTSQELACDEQVLKNKNLQQKQLYAKALVQCAEHASQHNLYPAFGGKRTMLKRLQMIKNPAQKSTLLAVVCIAVAATLSANTALATLPDKSAKTTEINIAQPVLRVDPTYPAEAAKQGQEGSVIMRFDITESGTTDNITVVDSFPEGVFDESAKAALAQWEYKPRIQAGQAQRQTGLLVQLDYRLGPDANQELEKIKVSSN